MKDGIADLYINPKDPKSPTTMDDRAKANILAEFYSSVFTDEPRGPIPEFEKRNCQTKMPFIEVTEERIEKLLKDVNPNKTPGINNIHPRILRELATELKEPMCKIFRKSLEDGKIPSI